MARNRIELSLEETMRSLGKSLKSVTSAAFAGQPGVAPTIKGKRRTSQVTFKLRGANEQRSIESRARTQILRQAFQTRGPELEAALKRALDSAIAGLVGAGNSNVRMFNRSLGSARPRRPLDSAPFVKFVKSRAGAGEIGLPDPEEAIRNLKAALLASITVDVIMRNDGPQIKFTFDQQRLLKLTPHPHRFERGQKGPFFSWLSLVTGPSFVSSTPGYSMVRASDIKASYQKIKMKAQSRGHKSPAAARVAEGLLSASRTRGNAGEFAAIMMRNKAKRAGGRSPAEVFGGESTDYAPGRQFEGYWDEYWMEMKIQLGVWTRRIVTAGLRELLQK